ncbi:phenylalanine 4-monooxygenase [Vibrio renipiscarius]|uniref:Phenylalanine-4-hydroxylase n=1 Tax=Vibrio renipiscarius TaxID=1461322 RepID=A0A0C2NK75_9VIBR|nr:phenylalanine 4-monooxygenase [Vibrio renipiscarius]KII76780.1 phenylalanine 4-monooxygenase [Vibrio renipiscarius]KII78339.1 phenylalanine 4-monooxygenase [Vibrio renipiscarius]
MSQYQSKAIDKHGIVAWSDDENTLWSELILRQLNLVKSRACKEYLDGLDMLDLPVDHIPQLGEINQVLSGATGWQVEPVPALISFDKFFDLLANRRFPVATFLRSREEFDYLQEPDFFHEIFGHCAMLTNPKFAHFTHVYGQLGQGASPAVRGYLARLYWFTVEFGLVREGDEDKIYGGGILSSPGETLRALEGRLEEAPNEGVIQREAFNINRVLRTPYRIDIMQPIYFVLSSVDELYQLSEVDLIAEVQRAQLDGLYPPLFDIKDV